MSQEGHKRGQTESDQNRRVSLRLPPLYSINVATNSYQVRQIIVPDLLVRGTTQPIQIGESRVLRFVCEGDPPQMKAILTPTELTLEGSENVLLSKLLDPDDRSKDLSSLQFTWLQHPRLNDVSRDSKEAISRYKAALLSWKGAFNFPAVESSRDTIGLRSPQVGAIHALHAHWSTSNEPATIVMPTGTGKTEVMLAVLVSMRCPRLFVVVPTDELRRQVFGKFTSLGLLKSLAALDSSADYPVVGLLKQRPKSAQEIEELLGKCNVVITTINIAGQMSSSIQKSVAKMCPYLFIDEAHHVPARTWSTLKENFRLSRIVQFTATPYRDDDKLVSGKIVYNYPLRLAQMEGYFRPINFKPIREFNAKRADRAIAKAAVSQLREDHQKYPDHILMARVNSIPRAEEVYKLYESYTEFNPIVLHTRLSPKNRQSARKSLLSGLSKIVVCVNMFGEGFDLPQLKIAAFHDIRKSLPITLQLIGRFVRAAEGVGDATAIANTGMVEVRDEMKKLFIRDADWNRLIQQQADSAIEGQVAIQEFIQGFEGHPDEINLSKVQLALSTVAYQTSCSDWHPENFSKGLPNAAGLEGVYHSINARNRTLIVLTVTKAPLEWANSGELYNYSWELFALYWDKRNQLLFINSATNKGYFESLAEAVAGTKRRINGPVVFRCLADIHRLRLYNVGLREQLSRRVRFTMRAGADVEPGISGPQRRNTSKSNLYGQGYRSGSRTSAGCSVKGRIWTHRRGTVKQWRDWCKEMGTRLLDETVDPDRILEGTLKSRLIEKRPQKMPIFVEWPTELMMRQEESTTIRLNDTVVVSMDEIEIGLHRANTDEPLAISIGNGDISAVYELRIVFLDKDSDYEFHATSGCAEICYGGRCMKLETYFHESPPIVWFADGSSLEGNRIIELPETHIPYDREKIEVWDWGGVDTSKEALPSRNDNWLSVQSVVVKKLEEQSADLIFNDDGAGEAADIIGLRILDNRILIELYHCKFASKGNEGNRIADLYEVCGQAQKNIHWKEHPRRLIQHMLRREGIRRDKKLRSRVLRGDTEKLFDILEACLVMAVDMKITIVQPGLSKSNSSNAQLELLAVTENYLNETCELPLTVVGRV